MVPGCLVSVGLGVLSAAVLIVGLLLAVRELESPEDFRRVEVPPGGEVDLEDAGEYIVHYEADSLVAGGACSEESLLDAEGGTRRGVVCDPELLAASERLTISSPSGDPLRLEEALAPAAYGRDRRERVVVWRIQVDEPGVHQVQMTEPPGGTHTVAFQQEGGSRLAAVVGFLGAPLLFLAAVVVGLVTLVRGSARRRQSQPPWPPPVDWA